MTRRYYSSIAQRTTLASPLSSGATTMIVSATTGFPGTRPYTLVIDPDTVNEEIVTVTAASGTTLTVTRGEDGTAAVAHDLGATVWHGFTGRDLGEPQAHMDSSSGVHGRTGEVVGDTDTQTLSNKTMSGADNTFTDIPQSAVTNLPGDLAAKAPINNPTFTGNVVLPASTTLGDLSPTELSYVNNATSNIQAQLDAKAPISNPSFTGTVSLPSSTSIGGVTATEISRLAGVTSNIQSQISAITGGGVAVPPGGDTGDVLVKKSATNYDMEWKPLSALLFTPGGGSASIFPDGALDSSDYDTTGTFFIGAQQFRYYRFVTPDIIQGLTADDWTSDGVTGVIGKLLVVGGGGGGGGNAPSSGFSNLSGGGGAGGLWYGDYAFGIGTHSLTVGAGGAGGAVYTRGANGGDSWIDHDVSSGTGGILCKGGGGGGGASGGGGQADGADGGSGGGGTSSGGTPGSALVAGYGFDGSGVNGGGAMGSGSGSGFSVNVTGSTLEYASGGYNGSDGGFAGRGWGGGCVGGFAGSGSYGGNNGCVIAMYRIA